jgi:hypothetical protein
MRVLRAKHISTNNPGTDEMLTRPLTPVDTPVVPASPEAGTLPSTAFSRALIREVGNIPLRR